MLYTVWTNYGAAEQNVDLEATSLRNIYRLAEGLPDPQHAQLQVLCRSYAKVVIEQDWPLMAQDQVPTKSHEINNDMWKTLMSVKTETQTQIIADDHALFELASSPSTVTPASCRAHFASPPYSGSSSSSVESSPSPQPACSAPQMSRSTRSR